MTSCLLLGVVLDHSSLGWLLGLLYTIIKIHNSLCILWDYCYLSVTLKVWYPGYFTVYYYYYTFTDVCGARMADGHFLDSDYVCNHWDLPFQTSMATGSSDLHSCPVSQWMVNVPPLGDGHLHLLQLCRYRVTFARELWWLDGLSPSASSNPYFELLTGVVCMRLNLGVCNRHCEDSARSSMLAALESPGSPSCLGALSCHSVLCLQLEATHSLPVQ